MAPQVSDLAEAERERHRKAVARAARVSSAADAGAILAREALNRTVAEAHGDPQVGKLTHDELVEASGRSRSWVRLRVRDHRKANTTP